MGNKRIFFVVLILSLLLFQFDDAKAQEPVLPDPQEIINAVNSLRLAYGLPALGVHHALMQIAQTEADGIAHGASGHWRPGNLTLGQWLLSLEYPLSGDLSMDGYRSENWVYAPNAQEAISIWLGDELHINTMLSENRSDIGAGVAYDSESEQIVVVLETALQTRTGQMQYDAGIILTSIPQTQAAYNVEATQWSQDTGISQYSVPVFVSTPLADGNVFHEVKYGQTLWSIAITYNTTVKQIQQLNHLTSTIVNDGQKLWVLTGAMQIAPPNSAVSSPSITLPAVLMTPVLYQTATPAIQSTDVYSSADKQKDTLGFIVIAIAAVLMGSMFILTKKTRD